jgi:hypothetical protein
VALAEYLESWTNYTEWLLDVRLTKSQRQRYQQILASNWNSLDAAAQKDFLRQMSEGPPSRLSRLNRYERNALRARQQPEFVTRLRQSAADESARWLLAVYEKAHRPGGSRNVVLVASTPVLTQGMADRFGDFAEWILDLSENGLTAGERAELQEMLVKHWENMDRDARSGFLKQLHHWRGIAALDEARRDELREQLQPAFVAQLRRSNDEASQWLLSHHDAQDDGRSD